MARNIGALYGPSLGQNHLSVTWCYRFAPLLLPINICIVKFDPPKKSGI